MNIEGLLVTTLEFSSSKTALLGLSHQEVVPHLSVPFELFST